MRPISLHGHKEPKNLMHFPSSYKGGHATDEANHSCENTLLTIVRIYLSS